MADQESVYIVSSLKYRPQTFEDVVGQEHVSRTLRNALQRQRLANGYIFTGPRGVGKTTSARILAKAINCENPSDGDPCNVCNHCIEITGGRSLDVLEVDGASTRGIDAIRELREIVKYPPTNSNYRVYIIDEVHMLTKEAFNALLKTLEEPPPQVLFIFATTEPQKVPLTILSRCQRYDFRMISTESMVARLKMISKNEKITISDDGLALIARKAAGSLRDSLSLLDQVSAFTEDDANLDLVRRVLGVLDVTIYFELMHHIASQSPDGLINQANLLFSRGISITEFLQGLSEHIRNLLVVKVAGITEFLDVSDTDGQAFEEQATYFEERDLIRMQTLVMETLRDQRFISNQTVSVELMLLKLARSSRSLDIDALLSGTPRPEPKIPKAYPNTVKAPTQSTKSSPKKVQTDQVKETAPVKKPIEPVKQVETKAPDAAEKVEPEAPKPAPVEKIIAPNTVKEEPLHKSEPVKTVANTQQTSDSPNSLAIVVSNWDSFIDKLGAISRSTGAFMSEGTPASFDGDLLTIVFAPEQKYHIQTLEKNLNEVQEVASKLFGTKTRIKLLERNGHLPKQRKADEILAHPTSQHLLDIFDGEVIDE